MKDDKSNVIEIAVMAGILILSILSRGIDAQKEKQSINAARNYLEPPTLKYSINETLPYISNQLEIASIPPASPDASDDTGSPILSMSEVLPEVSTEDEPKEEPISADTGKEPQPETPTDTYPPDNLDAYPEWLGEEPQDDNILPPPDNGDIQYETPPNDTQYTFADDSDVTLADIKQSIDRIFYCLTLFMAVGVVILIFKIVSPLFHDNY